MTKSVGRGFISRSPLGWVPGFFGVLNSLARHGFGHEEVPIDPDNGGHATDDDGPFNGAHTASMLGRAL